MGQHSGIDAFESILSTEDFNVVLNILKSSNWSYGHHSDANQDHKKFWNMNLIDDFYFADYFFEKIKTVLNINDANLLRVYANGQTFGLDGSWHQDSCKDNEFTFLYYSVPDWKISWGGETVFNVNGRIVSFFPKPNCALCFPGKIEHFARSPSRECYELRTTIAFKFEVND